MGKYTTIHNDTMVDKRQDGFQLAKYTMEMDLEYNQSYNDNFHLLPSSDGSAMTSANIFFDHDFVSTLNSFVDEALLAMWKRLDDGLDLLSHNFEMRGELLK